MTREQLINQVINNLNAIHVDGETMEHILEEVGMQDQMLRQLIMGANYIDLQCLLQERDELRRQGLL